MIEEAGPLRNCWKQGSGRRSEASPPAEPPRDSAALPAALMGATMPEIADAPRILVADDQPDVLEAARLLLKTDGYEVRTANSPAAILAAVEGGHFDAVLMDLNYTRDTTSGREGLDLLARLRVLDPELQVVVMTAWGSVAGAVEAMRKGARDYVEKPWDNERLRTIIRSQVDLSRALRAGSRLEAENRVLKGEGVPDLVAGSRAMADVLDMVERVAPSDANVLLTGEHGTGKEVMARWLHHVSSRSERAFLAVNAGGFSAGVFESELFGHVRGAFTDAKSDRLGCFELADQGTLFLDEIANVPLAQQSKLLRVLEVGEIQRLGSSKTRQVNVRIVSATNADLRKAVADGDFREDLLYRLNTVEIRLPALRERADDIPILARHFLAGYLERYDKSVSGFTPDAIAALMAHSWPGNIRELLHAVERGVLMARGPEIGPGDLGLQRRDKGARQLDEMTLDEAEQLLVARALERYDGNVSRAAEALGISRSALYRRMSRPEE